MVSDFFDVFCQLRSEWLGRLRKSVHVFLSGIEILVLPCLNPVRYRTYRILSDLCILPADPQEVIGLPPLDPTHRTKLSYRTMPLEPLSPPDTIELSDHVLAPADPLLDEQEVIGPKVFFAIALHRPRFNRTLQLSDGAHGGTMR